MKSKYLYFITFKYDIELLSNLIQNTISYKERVTGSIRSFILDSIKENKPKLTKQHSLTINPTQVLAKLKPSQCLVI